MDIKFTFNISLTFLEQSNCGFSWINKDMTISRCMVKLWGGEEKKTYYFLPAT